MSDLPSSGATPQEGDATGRVLVITGSGGDIGRALTCAAVAQGYRVFGLEVNPETGARTAEIAGGGARFIECDLGDVQALERAFALIEAEAGPVYGLVNNAARGSHVLPQDIDIDTWNGVLAITLTAGAFAAQFAARSMVASGAGGSIVNIASIAGLSALGRGNYAYSVAKHGVVGMTRELAVEWAASGIRVNAVAPSQVDTSGFRPLVGREDVAAGGILGAAVGGIPAGRLATVDDVTPLVMYLLSDDARFLTGATIPIDGGSLALHAGGTVGPRMEPVA